MRYDKGPATTEPVTLAEAMTHLRVDGYGESPAHPDEALIEALVSASREQAEDYTGRVFAPCEVVDRFPAVSDWPLALAPVRSVTSVEYRDGDGVWTELAPEDWEFFPDPEDPRVRVDPDLTYPSGLYDDDPYPWRVTYDAGYTLDSESPNDNPTPARVKSAILLLLGSLYENREDTVTGQPIMVYPRGFEWLLHPLRREIL